MAEGMGTLLVEAIEKAHRETLQAVLISMCSTSTVCALEASRRLLITQDEVVRESVPEIADLTSSPDAGAKIEDETHEEEDEDENEEDEDPYGEQESEDEERYIAPVAKRQKLDPDGSKLVVRYETCRKCKKQFDITTNGPTACHIHDGYLDVYHEEDFWADDDFPPEYGPHSPSDPMVRDCPDGFRWECCDGNGAAPPCVAGRHEV